MCFRENNKIRMRVYKSEHVNVINDFRDVNSVLYTVTNIHAKESTGFWVKYQCFSK